MTTSADVHQEGRFVLRSQLHPDDGGGPLVIDDPWQDGAAIQYLTAGLLVLQGGARGATGMTREMAAAVVQGLLDTVDELEAMDRADHGDPLAPEAAVISDLSIQRNSVAAQASDIISVLTGYVDWRERALEAEADLEQTHFQLGTWESGAREFLGPGERTVSDIRMLLDSLRGSVLAAEQQRAEQAAFALDLLYHLRRFPSSEMNEGLENIHHSICASPRTSASEAASHSYLEEAVEARALELGEGWREKYESLTRTHDLTMEASRRAVEDADAAVDSALARLDEYAAEKEIILRKLDSSARVYMADAEVLERRVVARFWLGIGLGAAGGVAALLVLRAMVG